MSIVDTDEPLLKVQNLSKYFGSRVGCADVLAACVRT